jgi:hypothetical protein
MVAPVSRDEGSVAQEAVEELIAEFGVRGLVTACLKSSAGDEFGRLGGNGALRIAQVILRQIVFAERPRLEAEVMALGAGILLEDKATMTRIADKYGFTKQALSKRVVKFCDEHNLPPSCYMRSKKDRETYALTNRPRSA